MHDADGVLTHLVGVQDTGASSEPDPVLNHDPLTGLPNRVVLHDRLGQALGRLRRRGGTVAVLFLDFDGFKQSTTGSATRPATTSCARLAARLRAALRTDDTVARLGGDEFVLLCEDGGGEAGAVRVAERVLQAFEAPFTLGDERLALRLSVGIALADSSDESATSCWPTPTWPCTAPSSEGGDGFALYDSSCASARTSVSGLARDLRAAIGTDQLSLHYQPIVDLGSQRVVSLEALVRWEHPVRGAVAPDEFVRLAEETGTIVELGRWVLERACTEFAAALDDTGGRQPWSWP